MICMRQQRHLWQLSPRVATLKLKHDVRQSRGKSVRIGCASGFWGDTPTAVPQLLQGGKLDFLMFDYLSELTMSLLTAAKAKKPDMGYAPDFIHYGVGPHLTEIKRQGIKVVANAGGINTQACVAALGDACKKAGVNLKIAAVTGDDMFPLRKELAKDQAVRELGTNKPLPATVHSMTAYFGAGPIVRALEMGADIVVTGRTADSALALAPCVHQLGWGMQDWDLLAGGSLAGHLIECGGQATGGLFTDWENVAEGYDNLGFPVVEVSENGVIELSKPEGTGGVIHRAAVAEQMLYEIGDPRNYILPDVICDFTGVEMMEDKEKDVVVIQGARGKPCTDNYKVSATYMDGYKATCVALIGGGRASAKGKATAEAIMRRARTLFKYSGMKDFDRTFVCSIGAEDSFGAHASKSHPRESALWMAVQHQDKKALEMWAREIASSGTGMAPGLCGMVGGRPKPSPCLKLYSFLYPKQKLKATVALDGASVEYFPELTGIEHKAQEPDVETKRKELLQGDKTYTLEELAYARSGDKGNSCNVGVIARHPSFLPYIKNALTAEAVAKYFEHYMCPDAGRVIRYDVPGIHAVNFLLDNSLDGGGIASLRPDPLGKAFGQILLSFQLTNMPDLEDIVKK